MAKPKAAKKQDAAIPEAVANGKPAGRGTKRTLAVGPLQIPTLYYVAARGESLGFNMIHDACLQKVSQQYVCRHCTEVEVLKKFTEEVKADYGDGKPPVVSTVRHSPGEKFVTHSDLLEAWVECGNVRVVGNPVTERNEIVKGFDSGNGTFIEITKEEIDGAKSLKDDTMFVEQFVPLRQVNPMYFESSYYLTPDPSVDTHTFAVLRKAMVANGVAAVVKFVASQREKLAFILPYGEEGMALHEAFLANEIRSIGFPSLDAVPAEEEQVASEFIRAMSGDLDVTKYVDTYQENLEALIEAKRNGEAPKKIEQKATQKATGSLIEMMKASIQIAKNKKAA